MEGLSLVRRVMAIFQARDDAGLIQEGAKEIKEEVSIRYIVKIKLMDFPKHWM